MDKPNKGRPSELSGIYALVLNGNIMYVGQSTNISKRYKQHCSINQNRSNRKVHTWITSLLEKQTTPELMVIEETNDLDNREIYWIDYYRNIGQATLNMADGGQKMGHLYRAKLSKPWGNHHSPVQKMLLDIKFTTRMLRRLGYEDNAERLDKRLLSINEKIKRIGLDRMNMILWSKYGNEL